jgi:dTDP-4-dehydrorhamnose reductase
MRILVTGANGQLGSELRELAKESTHQFIFSDVAEMDITSPDSIQRFIHQNPFEALINCAAYTQVDKAEEEEDKALLLNATAVKYLAEACNQLGAYMIHISTDYVFGGMGYRPYREEDKLAATSAYARTKAAGEKQFLDTIEHGAIVRTSWLYSSFGHNFVKTMMKYGQERESLRVVFDQVGTPTYAADLAHASMAILDKKDELDKKEVFHFSNEGVCSWYDFARAIMEITPIECKISPIRTEEYPLPAERPFYSVLDKGKIKEKIKLEIPHWRESLYNCIEKLK